MLTDTEQKQLSMISGDVAYQNIAKMIIPPDRPTGTPAERQAANTIKKLLEPYVDTCVIEEFPCTSQIKAEGSLEVVYPVQLTIPCTPSRIVGSGSGTVTLIDAGFGTKKEYDRLGTAVQGKAVLATCKTQMPSIEERMLMGMEARLRKASCLIYNITKKDDHLSQHSGNVDFPCICISNEQAAELRKLLSLHNEIKISFKTVFEYKKSTTTNVVGTILGSQFPEEVIYLTGHHDAWHYGANDNISSVACAIEAARMFKEHRPRRTIKFVSFGGEESGFAPEEVFLPGLTGSWGYSEMHKKELLGISGGATIGIINGELLGSSERVNAMSSACLLPIVREAVTDLGHIAYAQEPSFMWSFSDHLCFYSLGIPSIWLYIGDDRGFLQLSPWWDKYHSEQDNMDSMKPNALLKNASLMALLAIRLDSVDVPYSIESLRATATENIDSLKDYSEIARLFDEKSRRCLKAKKRETKLRYILDLAGVVNKNISTLAGLIYSNKFQIIVDAIERLRDARNIIEYELDMRRAKFVLMGISRAYTYRNWSKDVSDEIDRLTVESKNVPIRFSPYVLDLREIFDDFDKKETPVKLIALINSKLDEAVSLAEKWSAEYINSLKAL